MPKIRDKVTIEENNHSGKGITFLTKNDDMEDVWIMKMFPGGVIFNKEHFTDYEGKDFALEVIRILEDHFECNFTDVKE